MNTATVSTSKPTEPNPGAEEGNELEVMILHLVLRNFHAAEEIAKNRGEATSLDHLFTAFQLSFKQSFGKLREVYPFLKENSPDEPIPFHPTDEPIPYRLADPTP